MAGGNTLGSGRPMAGGNGSGQSTELWFKGFPHAPAQPVCTWPCSCNGDPNPWRLTHVQKRTRNSHSHVSQPWRPAQDKSLFARLPEDLLSKVSCDLPTNLAQRTIQTHLEELRAPCLLVRWLVEGGAKLPYNFLSRVDLAVHPSQGRYNMVEFRHTHKFIALHKPTYIS